MNKKQYVYSQTTAATVPYTKQKRQKKNRKYIKIPCH